MLDWIIATGGLLIFGLVLFLWVRWTETERKMFANGTGRHLE